MRPRKVNANARCVGLAPTKPLPSSQATRSHPGKAKNYKPKAPNETMMPMRRKKRITISHTQQRTPPVSTPFQPKRKIGEIKKKKRPTPGAR